MNLLKKAFYFFILLLFTFNTSFALVLEGDIKLDKATSNSLSLSWESVDGALGYFVYYDTVSHEEDKQYSKSTDDMIDGTGVVLDNLSSDTTYYIALRVVDGDGNEGDFSKEFSYSTLAGESKDISSLNIEKVDVINQNKVIVTFNVDIDTNKDIEFKIEDKNDNTKVISINNISINGNQVILKLADKLEGNKTYTLTVVSLTGVNGETIKAGVEGVIDFDTGENIELNSASESDIANTQTEGNTTNQVNEQNSIQNNISDIQKGDIQKGENIGTGTDLNSAGPETNSGTVLSGTNLSNNDIKKTPELAAKKTKKLPKTGPTEWLLLILALGLAFVITRFKKA